MTTIRSDLIGSAFQKIAVEFADFPAIVSEENQINYSELWAVAVSFAERMKAHGVDNRSLVALNTGNTLASLAVLLATSLLGCRFIVASAVAAKSTSVRPTHFYKTIEAVGKTGVSFVNIDQDWFSQQPHERLPGLDGFEGCMHPDDPWMLLNTSGTTGNPKILSLSHGVVYRRTMAVADDFPLARTTMASLFGNTSRPFYARALGCLLHAGTIVDSYDSDFWTTAGVNVVFGSPRQLEKVMAANQITGRFARLEASGAELRDGLIQELSKRFDKIVDVYGASETSKSFANEIEITDGGAISRSGKPLDSTIEILGEDGRLCPPGKPGKVRVRNDYLSTGYLGAPTSTSSAFKDGWFYPGDIAQWDEGGQLKVIGRADDVLSFGGLKLDANLLDLIITTTEGVKDAVCFKNPKSDSNDEILAFVVLDDAKDHATCIAQIRANYEEKLSFPCFLGNIHLVDTVPRNEDGKPMRALCQQMVLDRVAEQRSVHVP